MNFPKKGFFKNRHRRMKLSSIRTFLIGTEAGVTFPQRRACPRLNAIHAKLKLVNLFSEISVPGNAPP